MKIKCLFEKRTWHIESYGGTAISSKISCSRANFFQMLHAIFKIMTRK